MSSDEKSRSRERKDKEKRSRQRQSGKADNSMAEAIAVALGQTLPTALESYGVAKAEAVERMREEFGNFKNVQEATNIQQDSRITKLEEANQNLHQELQGMRQAIEEVTSISKTSATSLSNQREQVPRDRVPESSGFQRLEVHVKGFAPFGRSDQQLDEEEYRKHANAILALVPDHKKTGIRIMPPFAFSWRIGFKAEKTEQAQEFCIFVRDTLRGIKYKIGGLEVFAQMELPPQRRRRIRAFLEKVERYEKQLEGKITLCRKSLVIYNKSDRAVLGRVDETDTFQWDKKALETAGIKLE